MTEKKLPASFWLSCFAPFGGAVLVGLLLVVLAALGVSPLGS
jgi:hypothetical protein